jgi:chromosome segregation ATPase
MSGVASAGIALDEFRATQDEFTEFFGDVFDQLQALSLELFARHKCLEVSAEQRSASEETLNGFRDELQRSVEGLRQLQGQLQADQQATQQSWTEIRAGYQRFLEDHADLRELRESLRQIVGEFAAVKDDVQQQRKDLQDLYASVESQLSRLTTLAAELSEARTQSTNDTQIADILEHTKQQQAEWLAQRTALETELDTLRRRASEQAEALSEQKRLAGQQQAELAGELKRMRSLLDTLGSQVRGAPSAPGENAKPKPDENSVLGSVLAQFEMLQRDMNLRRTKRNNEGESGGKTLPST